MQREASVKQFIISNRDLPGRTSQGEHDWKYLEVILSIVLLSIDYDIICYLDARIKISPKVPGVKYPPKRSLKQKHGGSHGMV